MTWPFNSNEAGGDLVLIQTLLLLFCKWSCSYANKLAFTCEKQRGLYQSKVNFSLACIHGQVTKHTTIKWPITKPFEYFYLALCLDPPGRQITWNLHKRYIQLPGKDKPPPSSYSRPSNGTLPTKNPKRCALRHGGSYWGRLKDKIWASPWELVEPTHKTYILTKKFIIVFSFNFWYC